jgi:hypothetical protein
MIEVAEFFATFWGKLSIVAGGLFGVAIIAMIINALVSYYRNKTLNKILEVEKKNYALLKQIKDELKIK